MCFAFRRRYGNIPHVAKNLFTEGVHKMKSCRLVCAAAAFLAALVFTSARAATLTLGDATLSGDQLTVPVTVSGLAGESSLGLYLGAAEPKDGEPSPSAAAVVSQTISSDGDYYLTYRVTLGTKIAYRAGTGSDYSDTATMKLKDSSKYYWKANASGNWSDPGNWNPEASDLQRLGYPSYGSQFHFQGNQADTIYVDAVYTDMADDCNFGWAGANLTFIGTVTGAQLGFGGVNGFYDNTHVVLDNVRLANIANYAIKNNSSLTMQNGAHIDTRWWFYVSGANASLVVGSGCDIRTSNEWWYGLMLDGEDAKIVIDDGLIYAPRLRISSENKTSVPYGIVFKGQNPRLTLAEELNVHGTYDGSPVFEFYVPFGGYTSTPITKDRTGNFVAMGDSYLDHSGALAGSTTKLNFIVSERSPFFADTAAQDVELFDWSTSGINTDRVSFGTFEDSANNRFQYDSNNNQIWVYLTGTGEAFNRSVVASDVVLSKDDSTATVSVTATVEEVGDGTTTATCYIYDRERNGRASAVRQLGESVAVTTTGPISFSGLGVLGSAAACFVVLENNQGSKTYTSTSHTNAVELIDSAEYTWNANATGYWSDSTKWHTGTSDGLPRLGYPSNGGKFHFHGGQTDEVYVDGNYSGFGWNNNFAWDNTTVRVLGVSDNASITATSLDIYSNDHITLSNLNFRAGAYIIKNGSSLSLLDGATLSTTWEFNVIGNGASLYIGTNCAVNVGVGEDWHGTQIYGENTSIVIDNGTFNATYVWLGQKDGNSVSAFDGITFKGENAKLAVKGYIRNRLSSEQAVTFSFVIPEGGFASAPIVKSGSNADYPLFA